MVPRGTVNNQDTWDPYFQYARHLSVSYVHLLHLFVGTTNAVVTSSTVDPMGFSTVVGNQVFFVNLLVAIASLVLLYRQLNGRRVVRRGHERFMRAAGTLKQRRRACLAGLLVVIPLMCLLTGLLPNVFSRFSRAEHNRLA